jgi:hypothetical protein
MERVKVKWSRYMPGVAQRVGRGITLLFHDRGTRRGWVVSSTPRPHFTPGKDPVPILQEAGWAPGSVWRGGKSRPHRDSILDRPARSQSLYRLSYPAHDGTSTEGWTGRWMDESGRGQVGGWRNWVKRRNCILSSCLADIEYGCYLKEWLISVVIMPFYELYRQKRRVKYKAAWKERLNRYTVCLQNHPGRNRKISKRTYQMICSKLVLSTTV